MEAAVVLTCDATAGLGTPLLASTDGCAYTFVWRSAAACAVQTYTGANCAVTDEFGTSHRHLFRIAFAVADSSGTA